MTKDERKKQIEELRKKLAEMPESKRASYLRGWMAADKKERK